MTYNVFGGTLNLAQSINLGDTEKAGQLVSRPRLLQDGRQQGQKLGRFWQHVPILGLCPTSHHNHCRDASCPTFSLSSQKCKKWHHTQLYFTKLAAKDASIEDKGTLCLEMVTISLAHIGIKS